MPKKLIHIVMLAMLMLTQVGSAVVPVADNGETNITEHDRAAPKSDPSSHQNDASGQAAISQDTIESDKKQTSAAMSSSENQTVKTEMPELTNRLDRQDVVLDDGGQWTAAVGQHVVTYTYDMQQAEIKVKLKLVKPWSENRTQKVVVTPFKDIVSQPAHTNGEINHVFENNNWAEYEYEMTKKLSSEEQKQKSFKLSLDGFNGTDHVVSLNLDLKLPGPIVNDHVSEPGTDSLDAHSLILPRAALGETKIQVTKADGSDFPIGSAQIYRKPNGSSRSKYGSQTAMKENVSTDYVPSSSATAVIFKDVITQEDGLSNVLDAKLKVDINHVGSASDLNGRHFEIGAYVEMTNIHVRRVEWAPTPTDVGIDFSNNFFSGMSFANVLHYDWRVVFYEKETGKRLNFIPQSDLNQNSTLTFTSLNPGEFVWTEQSDINATYNADYVTDWQFQEGNWITANKDVFDQENLGERGTGQKGYTSKTWGNWVDPIDHDNLSEWEDRLGAPTFGRGAVAYTLNGTSHTFKQGTFSSGGSTWVANGSGQIELIDPNVTNNKSVSAQAIAGGGAKADKNKPIWTSNDLHNQVVNEHYQGDPFYYYINQEVYSMGDYVVKPTTITVTDLLSENIELIPDQNNGPPTYEQAFQLFNATDPDAPDKDRAMSLTSGVSSFEVTEEDGRQRITLTIGRADVQKIYFHSGFFSLRLKVRPTLDPDTIDQRVTMTNSAVVKFFDTKERYSKETNEVDVHLDPLNRFPASITKKNQHGALLEGTKFTLKQAGQPLQEAVTNAQGQATFTGLRPGKYTVAEVMSPGHLLQPEFDLIVAENGDVTIGRQGEIWDDNTVVNQLKPTELELLKVNKSNKPLAKATFALYRDGQTEPVASDNTNDEGRLLFDHQLTSGNYRLVETKAPEGFDKLAGAFTFTINQTGTMVDLKYSGSDLTTDDYEFKFQPDATDKVNHISFTVVNHSLESLLPKTGGNGIVLFLLMALVAGASGLLLAIVLKRKEAR